MKPYYEQDGIQIYHGDCREQTAWLSGDVLLTDPPYGMNYSSGWQSRPIANDEDTTVRDAAISLWGDRPALVFGRWNCPHPASAKMVLTWDKGDWPGMGDLNLPWGPSTEEIYVIGSGFVGRRAGSIVRAKRLTGDMSHPNEKPVSLLTTLIERCPPPCGDCGPVHRIRNHSGSGQALWPSRHRHRDRGAVLRDSRQAAGAGRAIREGSGMTYFRRLSSAWRSSHSRIARLSNWVREGCIGCALAYSRSLSSNALSNRNPICSVAFFSGIAGESTATAIIFDTPRIHCLTLVAYAIKCYQSRTIRPRPLGVEGCGGWNWEEA